MASLIHPAEAATAHDPVAAMRPTPGSRREALEAIGFLVGILAALLGVVLAAGAPAGVGS